ncbi:protein TIME FOR COFFEE-like isoform X1 [Vigna unguiculata]|uniref:protein TIME FOR COFFEE-like isoform X1 n=1 Tax=Vigna unguiculata TaxID=3917 RepID=UPI00101620FE|nr:protein TIME FOR COFFEE-like isoform X1 [Vigna unguiculata]
MDRTRGRSSSMSANAFPRRRHPNIPLRPTSQEVQEMRLKDNNDDDDNNSKREWTKKRRGSNSHSTEEESVGNEQDARLHSNNTASSASDHNHRGRNVIDEVMIGATVPRRTRSASVKRPHHSWVEEQSAEAASPSSSNVSLPKKMKAIGPSSSNQEDIEIEIAELLYSLRASQNHDYSSSQKDKASDSPALSSYPAIDVETKKVEDNSSSFCILPPNNSIPESVVIESQQPAKTEKPSSVSPRTSGGDGIESSQGPKQDAEEDSLSPGCGCGDAVDGKSESKLVFDKHDCVSTISRTCDDFPEGNDKPKFEIDLMAPPPVTLSSEWDNLSRDEDSNKVEDRVESLSKKEKTLGEIEEVKMKVDLEKPNGHHDLATNHELGELGRNKEQPTTTATNAKLEKTGLLPFFTSSAQCSSMSLSVAVSERPSGFSPLGYVPPLGTAVNTDKTTGLLTAPQHGNFVLSQPRPKRCASHGYIARNIFMHQQCTKMNTLLPSAIGSGSICDTKLSKVHSAESVVVGKQFHKQSPGVSHSATPEKGWATTSDFSVAAIKKSSGPANPVDMTQTKQLMLQQGQHPGSSANIVHGPAFLIPPGQHQASVIPGSSPAGGVNNASNASLSNKFQSSPGVSLGGPTLPAVAASMSFSYPNLAANDTPYMTIVPNSGYPFPFSTPLGPSAAIRGASPAQSTPILNGPLYSSQIFHPLQYPQQHPHSQPLVQPSYLNGSTSSVSSSSHKQSQGMQGNNNHILSSTTMQLQQSQKQHISQSHLRKHETGIAGENSPFAASGTAYSQKNGFGQNFPIPVQPLGLSLTPSTTSDSVGGNSGNFGDKQQQTLMGGLEHIPSQPHAISFAAYNGTSVPSNLNFSTMAQNPVIFQSLPDIAWQGYHAASASHATQQKMYPIIEGNSGDSSSHRDDEKATSGKPSTNGPTTLVFDNSAKNLNLVSSPMNGNWPSRSISSTATTTSLPPSSNAAKSQQPSQLLHLQQQHGMLQQQPAVTTRYKASSTNAAIGANFFTSPVYSQTQTQSKSSIKGSQSRICVAAPDSLVHNPCIVTSTAPTLQSFSQDQGRVLQGQTQISFGGNYISSMPLQGQQLFNNNQSLGNTVAGVPPSGANLKTNSQGSKVSSSVNSSQMQQTENSSTGTGQKSSPVCGRNVPSILSSCPSHLSELKY